jgi:hypothetical protein
VLRSTDEFRCAAVLLGGCAAQAGRGRDADDFEVVFPRHAHEDVGGDRAVDQAAEAFAGVLVGDGHDLDRAAVGGGVELEVHRPHPVWRVSGRHTWCGAGAQSLAASPLRHPQAIVAPKPLDLLVIDNPARRACIVVGGAEAASWMVFRVLAKPGAQSGIGVGWGRCGWLVALGGSVLPGHPAGEPLRDTHRVDEVMHSRPPALRA